MNHVFYADIFWLQNSLMNGIILLIAGRARKIPYARSLVRVLAIAAAGGAAETGLLLLTGSYRLYLLLSHILVMPVMVFAAFGKSGIKVFIQNIFLCYGVAVLLGGCVEAVENTAGILRLSFFAGVLGAVLAEFFFRYFYRRGKEQKRLFPMELQNGEYHVWCDGLLDSGNLLREPVQKLPVHIVSPGIMQKLHVEKENCMGVIPFRALGTADGILEIYRIDGISIMENGAQNWSHPAVLAKAEDGLFTRKQYQIIVNPAILEK